MAYKTILVHIDTSQRVSDTIKIAVDMAIGCDAHLIGIAATGLSGLSYLAGERAASLIDLLASIETSANEALLKFKKTARESGVKSFEGRLLDEDAGTAICLQARYSDLVIIDQIDPAVRSSFVRSDFPEYVILHSDRPVLTIPYAGQFEIAGKKIVVAWDAGKEAARAVHNALPILLKAEVVQIVIFNPSGEQKKHEQEPGSEIVRYLARFNIKAEVSVQVNTLDPGNSLLSYVADCSADLLVMGAYAHSRYREIFLGGMTNTILKNMTIPVLFSH